MLNQFKLSFGTQEWAMKVQAGNLRMRRFNAMIVASLISFNIWLDTLLGYLVKNIEDLTNTAAEMSKHWSVQYTVGWVYNPTPDIEFMQLMLLVFMAFSLVGTVFLWWGNYKAVRFHVGDQIVQEKSKAYKFKFWGIFLSLNIVIYMLLTNLVWSVPIPVPQ